MADNVVFKSRAFGGFDKTEVMDYVNKLLEEKASVEKRLSESNAKFAQANAQLFEMKKNADDIENYKAQLEEALAKIEELNALASEKTVEAEELKAQLTQKDEENCRLRDEMGNMAVPRELQAELESAKAEIGRLKVEAEKKRDLERQVGAAMLDARIHSEELVEEAKEKANAVTKNVYSAIGETAVKIDDLSTGIGEIARSFTRAVEEVELRIKALTGDMSKTAQLLIAESGVMADGAAGEAPVEYDFSVSVDSVSTSDNDSDVQAVEFVDEQGEE